MSMWLARTTNILGPDDIDRAIAKTWVNASFGKGGLLGQWSDKVKKSFVKKYSGGRLAD